MTNAQRSLARAPLFVRLDSYLIRAALRLGLPLGPMVLLTVIGRKSGQPRTTPVGLFKLAGHRYLCSTFGEVNWVRNLRAAGQANLTRGRWSERVGAVELPPETSGPILQQVLAPFLAVVVARPILRAWYGVTPHSSPSDLLVVAKRHPVFELTVISASK